jgi:prepilin signal peptidase PulO-like enzyme (type II secretory pathway)
MTSSLVTAGSLQAAGTGAMVLVTTHIGRGAVTAVVGVVGLLIGSFLNVVIYRVPRRLSVVEPRSFCPHCDSPLVAVDNIPLVSWAVLGGRCRRCRGPISVRYPLVELATGVVFALVGWGLGPHWAVAGFCVVAATLIALVAIEGDGLAPPVAIGLVGTALAVALLVAAGVADRRWAHVIGVAIGAGVALVAVAAIRRFAPELGETSSRNEARSWSSGAPVLLPAGAALGWLGPAYVGEGLGTAVVVLLVARTVGHGPRAGSAPADESAPGNQQVLCLAVAVGVLVATAVAVALGAGAGT